MIVSLTWDSNFFKETIHRVDINVQSEELSFRDILISLQEKNTTCAYIFLNQPDNAWYDLLKENSAKLVDEKILFQKKLSADSLSNFSECKNIIINYSMLNDNLINLSYEAGKYSRFKVDPLFHDSFKKLYLEWITNSLNKKIADTVIVYEENGLPIGMVTGKLDLKNCIGTIGLISVLPNHQSLGIGKQLLLAIELYFIQKGMHFIQVSTQAQNKQACLFYEKLGFSILSINPIFHLWLKNKQNDTI